MGVCSLYSRKVSKETVERQLRKSGRVPEVETLYGNGNICFNYLKRYIYLYILYKSKVNNDLSTFNRDPSLITTYLGIDYKVGNGGTFKNSSCWTTVPLFYKKEVRNKLIIRNYNLLLHKLFSRTK